jgi:hypothetical protein
LHDEWVVVLILLSSVITVQGGNGTTPPIVGPNILVGTAFSDCCGWSVTLASNPSNANASFVAVGGLFYYTLDGGRSWSPRARHIIATADPALAYDALGTLYWSNLFGAPKSTNLQTSGLRVDVSKDNGMSWGTPSVIVTPTDVTKNSWPDKEWLTVDNSNSSFRGRLYLAWEVRAPGAWQGSTIRKPVERLVLSHSDNGFNFSTPLTIAGSDSGFPTPAVGPNGQLYIVYVQWEANGDASLQLRASYDGGVTFGAPSYVAYYSGIPWKLSNTEIRILSIPYVAVDPIRGTIYVVWAQYYPSINRSAIVISLSKDGGRTWSPTQRVSDNVSGNDEFFPAVAVGHDGVVHIAWLDRRNDPGNTAFDVYYARSLDNGKTFEANIKVSEQPSNPNDLLDPTFITDYIGISVDADNRVHVAWNGVGPDRIAATYIATIYQLQTTTTQTSTLSTSEELTGTTPSERVASSSTLMTLVQSQPIAGSNLTYAIAAIGVLTLVAVSVIATKRKRIKHG